MPTTVDKNAVTWVDTFSNFLDANWFSIFSWIIGIALAIFLYYLQNKRANSAYLEQVKQAKKEIIDTLENYIINDIPINEDMIENLRSGTERNYKVIIENEWNTISTLQDINFRLQTSRHLAITQKAAYSKSLDELINQFKTNQSDIGFNSINNDNNLLIKQILDQTPPESQLEVKKIIFKILNDQENKIKSRIHNERFKSTQFDKIIISIVIAFSLTTFLSTIVTKSGKLEAVAQNTVNSLISISNIDTLFVLFTLIVAILTAYYSYLDHKSKRKKMDD
ncbi:hypothetical protein F3J02_13430 [Acinetobacter sp. Tr-809]|uniref:hypothetical protein n=1 Tax=Acinetobacter sp. Tr-809 TaxID=2608324 RepID=UPI001421CCD8|nr:hypothetical protein [Acinetobacter sp. Tr-809]NIE97467.1 hypothetical protein [Acinetobacter sp. Tr-809]